MGGNRKTSATKGGKYMNPTDQARKEDRKKQLKKHKKQREQVREAVIKNKNPNSVLEELSKLDDLEFDTENECPYADRVMQEKRLRLRSTYFKILEYYKNTGKMDTWKDYQDDFNTYEKERDRKKSLYQAVLKAKNWSVDHIPLPDMPMPDGSGFPISAPMGLPPKKLEITKTNNRIPPGPPPGPPPDKKKFKKRDDPLKLGGRTNVQKSLLALAGQDDKEEEEETPPPPPPGVPPLANRPKAVQPGFTNPFQPRQAVVQTIQNHIVPQQVNYQQYQPTPSYQQAAAPQQQQAVPSISAAPQVYKPPSGNKAVRGEAGAVISSAPIINKPKVNPTMFVPTAIRLGKGGSGRSVPQSAPRKFVPMAATTKAKDPDKAYEKFMSEMSSLM